MQHYQRYFISAKQPNLSTPFFSVFADEGVKTLLSKNPHLQTLILKSARNITHQLADTLKKMPVLLTYLDISNTAFVDDISLSEIIIYQTQLRSLNISEINFADFRHCTKALANSQIENLIANATNIKETYFRVLLKEMKFLRYLECMQCPEVSKDFPKEKSANVLVRA